MLVHGTCEECGRTFELTRSEMFNVNVPRRYCGRMCASRAKHKRRRVNFGPCQACGFQADRVAYGLTLCETCQNVAYGTCWRKWQCRDKTHALDRSTDIPIYAYECPLCGYWHVSRTDEKCDPDDRRQLLAELFRRVGFRINDARGWRRVWIGVSERPIDDRTD